MVSFRATPLPAQAAATTTTDQAFKNIQILKGLPADQLIPTMQFVSASLGVECEFCHVEGAFDKDDKKPKQTARKMMEMMLAINKNSFDNRRKVTCYTCHRGNADPIAIPIIPAADANVPNEPRKSTAGAAGPETGANAAAVIDPILAKYIAAMGGVASIEKLSSLVGKGSADLSGKQFPIEIYAKAPNKRISIMHLPNGDSITAYNGTVGWQSVPGRPTQWMNSSDADAARLDAELLLPVHMRQIFGEFRVLNAERIDSHEVNVVQGLRPDQPPVNFYFDQQSGLLVRMVRFAQTALGLYPTQVDYADYRDSSGVKIPYRWRIARPRGQFTIQLDSIQQNVTIDERKFAAPAVEPAQKPSK
jgi:hypothetical protein